MATEIANRISSVVKETKLTKSEFAKKLGVSQPHISRLCSGETQPSDRTIQDICREFGVDRVWLEKGEGQMFTPVSRDRKIAAILGSAIKGSDSSRDRVIRALAALPDELFPAAEQILRQIVENLENEKAE